MAELLVRTIPAEKSGNYDLDRHRPDVGDICCVVEDGWKWSEAELITDYWCLIKMPGVPAADIVPFLVGDDDFLGLDDKGEKVPNTRARRRKYKINLAPLLVSKGQRGGRHEDLVIDFQTFVQNTQAKSVDVSPVDQQKVIQPIMDIVETS